MTFTKALGVVMVAMPLLLAGGCKKDPPEPAKPAAPARAKAPVIEPVNFESGSTTISEAEMAAVEHAARIMSESDWTCLVLGLADSSGDAAMNKELSEKRAEAVAAALRSRVQVRPNRIVTHAIGERLATGATQSERKVEFIFFHDEGLPLREVAIRSGVLEEDFRAKREQRMEGDPNYQPK